MLKDESMIPHRLLGMVMWIFLALGMMGSDCGTRQPTIEDGNDLSGALRTFHKYLRWARYEDASRLVAPEYRQTFLGRYEELGEDFHVVKLEVVKVEMLPGTEDDRTPKANVQVEQEWYIEPNMTVKEDTFIERWRLDRQSWILVERLPRDEWREREKAKQAAAAAKKEAGKEPAPKEEPPSDPPTPPTETEEGAP